MEMRLAKINWSSTSIFHYIVLWESRMREMRTINEEIHWEEQMQGKGESNPRLVLVDCISLLVNQFAYSRGWYCRCRNKWQLGIELRSNLRAYDRPVGTHRQYFHHALHSACMNALLTLISKHWIFKCQKKHISRNMMSEKNILRWNLKWKKKTWGLRGKLLMATSIEICLQVFFSTIVYSYITSIFDE